MRALFFALILGLLPTHAEAQAQASTPYVTATLLADAEAVVPGQPLMLGLRLDTIEGWHTYWSNPGDSGLPTTLVWSLPEGVEAGPLQWPMPEAIPFGPVMNYGFHDAPVLLTPVIVPKSLQAVRVTLGLRAAWLVCADVCIPEEVTLSLDLPVAETAAPANQAIMTAALDRLPAAGIADGRLERSDDGIVSLVLEGTMPNALAAASPEALWYFPDAYGVLDHAAPQTWTRTETGWRMSTAGPPASSPLEAGDEIAGVVTLAAAGGGIPEAGWSVTATLDGGTSPALAPAAVKPNTPGGGKPDRLPPGLALALGLAFLGGMILNLMPCVFPVLAMKAMALVQHRSGPQSTREALLYTAGVLVSMAALGGVLLGLKTSGALIGWGFQLQEPWVIITLIAVLSLVALNLAGWLDVGSGLMGMGQAGPLARMGSFGTGVLAVVVASPCTAPFMGVALGAAMVMPAVQGMAVFLALGFGLAAPFLLLALVPGAGRLLPKPGPWMDRFKQFLAFPMAASVVWLLWVLGQQAGPDAAALVLLGLLALSLALWSRALSSNGGRALVAALAVAILCFSGLGLNERLTGAASSTALSAHRGTGEPYDADALLRLTSAGQPVFVNLTAAWCITCLVNERVALSSATVHQSMAKAGVTYMTGDWTNRDPAITALLQRYGRSGVPLYLMFPGGAGLDDATVLPQVLTEGLVLDALRQVSMS